MGNRPPLPTLGLALGGGGARGLSHVGILRVLEAEGIEADVVAGASMGGLIGAAYAAGFPVSAIEREVLEVSRRSKLVKLADWRLTLQGLFSGKKFEAYLGEVIGTGLTFADLKRPLALAASDLVSGREIVLKSGRVVPAMRATMSIPGVFAPVEWEGRYRLVDGGILNNVPADLARSLGADVVVAVDVLPFFRENAPGAPPRVEPLELPYILPGMRDVWEATFVAVSALTACNLQRSKPEVVIRPALPADVTLVTGFNRAEYLVEAGARAARAALPAIRAALETRTQASART